MSSDSSPVIVGRASATAADAETMTPAGIEELVDVLASASAARRRVAIWGGGTHRAIGHDVVPDLIISTAAMIGVEDWQPDDLTVVVKAGTSVADLETQLGTGGQTAVLPEQAGQATVGGVVATATSGFCRLRYGPTRDRVLEVRAVTGDGRVVKGGGRVVKNVSGYDLPRLFTGSLGSLGVITSVCLKLWPLTEATATARVATPAAAEEVHRPLAILESRQGVSVFLAGTGPEVDDQTRRLGGDFSTGLDFPAPLRGEAIWSIRVPPSWLGDAVSRIPAGSDFVAQHGVGVVDFGAAASFDVADLREWAESRAGAVVRLAGAPSADPWGTPPPGLALQRRVVEAFDPARILEPGRLPGRI